MFVAIDFGITNTDVAVNQNGDDIFYSFPSRSITNEFIDYIFNEIDLANIVKKDYLLNEINKKEKLGLNINNIILNWKFNSIIRSNLLGNFSKYIKKNKFNLGFVYKKIFSQR